MRMVRSRRTILRIRMILFKKNGVGAMVFET